MLNILNLTTRELGSVDALGKSLVSIFMPACRALGGSSVRNSRADFARGENGLNFVETSVMNLVIIFAAMVPEHAGAGSRAVGLMGKRTTALASDLASGVTG